jgi:hypothetical protein
MYWSESATPLFTSILHAADCFELLAFPLNFWHFRGSYQELKENDLRLSYTIPLQITAKALKLIFHDCPLDVRNPFNQVCA